MATDNIIPVIYIFESKVVADEYVHTFNRKVETDLNDDWVQHGNMFAVGNQFAVNMVRIKPEYKNLVERTFNLAKHQLAELENM